MVCEGAFAFGHTRKKRPPALSVGMGDRVEFVEIAPGRFEFVVATRHVAALKGMFGKTDKQVSIEEMNAAIAAQGAAAR